MKLTLLNCQRIPSLEDDGRGNISQAKRGESIQKKKRYFKRKQSIISVLCTLSHNSVSAPVSVPGTPYLDLFGHSVRRSRPGMAWCGRPKRRYLYRFLQMTTTTMAATRWVRIPQHISANQLNHRAAVVVPAGHRVANDDDDSDSNVEKANKKL